MGDHQIYALAAIAKALIQAMGMEAENKQRERNNYAPAYDESAFEQTSNNMIEQIRGLLG